MCVLESWFSLGDNYKSVWIFPSGVLKMLTPTETVLRSIVFIVWIFCNLSEPIFNLKVLYFVHITSKEVSLVVFKICALLFCLFFFFFSTGTVFCMLKLFQGKIFALETHSSYICLKSRKAYYCLFHEITQPINQDLNEYQDVAFILSAY